MAAEAGADVAKFQHFKSKKISGKGFSTLGNLAPIKVNGVNQNKYTTNIILAEWDKDLIEACADANIEFMTTPYTFSSYAIF